MKTFLARLLPFLFITTLLFAQEDYRGLVSDDFRHRFEDYDFDLASDMIGPRGMGMGGANLAASNDPTAIYFNPASLSSLAGFNLTVSGKMNFDSQEHKHPQFSGMAVRTSVTPLPTVDFATATVSLPLGNRILAFGVGYRALRDMSVKLTSTQFYYGGLRINENENNHGGVKAISPSIAFDILPSLSFGVTYNKIFGESRFELKLISPFADNTLYFQFNDGEKYQGSGIDGGLLWKPVAWLSLGAKYSPKWRLTIEELDEKLVLFQGQLLEYQEVVTPKSELATFTVDVPAELGLGLAIKPFSKTTVSADIRSQKWSDIAINSSLNRLNPISEKLTDTMGWFAGLEQTFPGAKWSVPVRAGLFSKPLPTRDRLFKGTYEGEQLKSKGWSMGIGVHSSSIKIDFAFSRSIYTVGWWMTASDYYNERMFETTERYNRVLLALTLSL